MCSEGDHTDVKWDKNYEELKRFICREGHCNIPYDFNENPPLGLWVHDQRTHYKYLKEGKPSNISDNKIRYLEAVGFKWSPTADAEDVAWCKMYEKLKRLRCREGSSNNNNNNCNDASSSIFIDDPEMVMWVNDQRNQYQNLMGGKQSNLTAQRIRDLEAIRFSWHSSGGDPDDVIWYEMYEKLKTFKNREGHFNVPFKINEKPSLKLWVAVQRTQYKYMLEGKPSNITLKRKQFLDAIGFTWTATYYSEDNVVWDAKFGELKKFKDREGHCNVPCSHKDNPSLGRWVNEQRTQYKCYKEGKACKLTKKKICDLESVGFRWNAEAINEFQWFRRFEELKQFKSDHGHCNVPYGYKKNKSLGNWVSSQRAFYKQLKLGRASSMNDSRIKLLDGIGFCWSVRTSPNDEWNMKYKELKQFQSEKGYCHDTLSMLSEDPVLAMWVNWQRTEYKNKQEGQSSSISELQIQLLDEIGFVWSEEDEPNASWMNRYDRLREFKSNYGHFDVMYVLSDNKSNRRFEAWVTTQKLQYENTKRGKSLTMTEERMRLLNAIDFP